jgi:hypothetical protein
MNKRQNTVSENEAKQRPIFELLIILALGITVYIFATSYDILERIVEFSRQHENWELDEFITVSVFFVFALALFSLRRWKEVINSNMVILQHNKDLHTALSELKQLRGIIPICASCKDIRDDEGFWHQVELYVRDHSEAEFSHGICPDCKEKLYPEVFSNEE